MSSLRGAHDQHDKSMTALEPAPADTWIRRHRLISYFALAYAISWPLWLLSRLAGGTVGTVLLVIGAFGPPLAAAITIRLSGGPSRLGCRPRSSRAFRPRRCAPRQRVRPSRSRISSA